VQSAKPIAVEAISGSGSSRLLLNAKHALGDPLTVLA